MMQHQTGMHPQGNVVCVPDLHVSLQLGNNLVIQSLWTPILKHSYLVNSITHNENLKLKNRYLSQMGETQSYQSITKLEVGSCIICVIENCKPPWWLKAPAFQLFSCILTQCSDSWYFSSSYTLFFLYLIHFINRPDFQ